MKKGRESTRSEGEFAEFTVGAALAGGEQGSSLYRLLEGGQGRLEFAPVAHLLTDRQAARGSVAAFGSEGFVAAEHVPNRF
jgi:hypothetical protein